MEEQSYTSSHPLGHTGPVTESLYLLNEINQHVTIIIKIRFNITVPSQPTYIYFNIILPSRLIYSNFIFPSGFRTSAAVTKTCLATPVGGRWGSSSCWSIETLARYGQIMVMSSCPVGNAHVSPSITGRSVAATNTTMVELHGLPCLPPWLHRSPSEP